MTIEWCHYNFFSELALGVKTLAERRLLNHLYTYYREIMFIQKGAFIFIFQGSCSLPEVIGLFMVMETKIKITFL